MTREARFTAAVLPPLLAGVLIAPAQDRPRLTPEAWLNAVETHEPGQPDQVAIDVGLASSRDLSVVLESVTRLAKGGGMNATLERGAWLHADIALLVPGTGGPGFDRRRRSVVLFEDGRALGRGFGSRHLEFAWALLSAIKPSPAGNNAARRWYQAMGAVLLRDSQLADAQLQFDDARRLFPDEAWVAFDLGCLNEWWAAPRVQQVVRSWGSEPRPNIASERTQLRRAEGYLEQALETEPDFTEARLRLGRVVGLDGRHEDAVRELERVIGAEPDAILAYYAHLFLGHEYEALGRADDAREQYERAAGLYSRAQSPYLALSHLARVRGDAAAALDAVHRILDLPGGEADREDPWWVYHLGRGRDADTILERARREAIGGGP